MRVKRLTASNFRNLEKLELIASPGLNLLVGPNGAGKTTILEAMVVLAKGRSFRGGRHQDLIGRHGSKFQIHISIETGIGPDEKLGLERNASTWHARRNGESVKTLTELSSALPLVVVEPNSHKLVDGNPEHRRRMLDWGVFHVKPAFLGQWQRYRRTLKQRNAYLKKNKPNQDLIDSLDKQMVQYAVPVTHDRESYVTELKPKTKILLELLSDSLPEIETSFSRGWSGPGFAEYLLKNRSRDRELGATAGGPHRADLKLLVAGEKARDRLSRGQQKLLAAALLLAQAQIMSEHGTIPVLLIDDLASEFDRQHLDKMLSLLASTKAQIWLTGVDKSLIERTKEAGLDPLVFHVKQGHITPA